MQALNISRKEKNLCEVFANETQTEKQLTNKHPGKNWTTGAAKKKKNREREHIQDKRRDQKALTGGLPCFTEHNKIHESTKQLRERDVKETRTETGRREEK